MPGPRTTLCENCGYDIDSLVPRLAAEPDLNCPECGKPIAESLPERRAGTPWQRRPWIGGYLPTWWRVLVAPTKTFTNARAATIEVGTLLFLSAGIACLLWPLIWLAPLVALGAIHTADGVAFFLLATGGPLGIAVAGCILLAMVSTRLESRLRQWRLPGMVRTVVITHAMTQWSLGPLFALPLATLIFLGGPNYSQRWVESIWLIVAAIVLHFLIPLALFFRAVAIGRRAMRFANPPRQAAA